MCLVTTVGDIFIELLGKLFVHIYFHYIPDSQAQVLNVENLKVAAPSVQHLVLHENTMFIYYVKLLSNSLAVLVLTKFLYFSFEV